MMNDDLHETLDASCAASQDEIKRRYRTLAKELHPDLNPGTLEADHQTV
ncbi:MAG: DnaJ domain-containing protein [Pseudomonadota bacterium]